MPRPKKEGAPEPKRRSRTGCWPCKARKVKCGEEKPKCQNCERTGEACDYSIRLNWGGRTKNKDDIIQFDSRSATPSSIVFPTPEELTGQKTPSPSQANFDKSPKPPGLRHVRSHSSNSSPRDDSPAIDPELVPNRRSHSRSQSGTPQDFRRVPDIQGLPVGLAHSMGNGMPRSTITSAPAGYNYRPQISDYPSPSISSLASPGFSGDAALHDPSAGMLPPFRTMAQSLSPPIQSQNSFDDSSSGGHRTKRLRVGLNGEASPMGSPMDPTFDIPEPRNGNLLNTYNNFNGTPLTPGSSIGSDEYARNSSKYASAPLPSFAISQVAQDPPDLRRLSVQSLLADPEDVKPWPQPKYPMISVAEETTTYGYDLGLPDLDTPRNDDLGAILPFSPPARRQSVLEYLSANGETELDDSPFNIFSGESKVIAFEPGGYYASPVAIKIPHSLGVLPEKLMENKMNLLYFHHFLNHTARILAPHDCAENPFRTVLPEMALTDPDLMDLLLAYSATHRARLLHHPEPSNRIAVYVQDVFPKLQQALLSDETISISTLATTVMLTSLEIMAPGAFGVGIPWRQHLSIARQMIVARGGTQMINRSDKHSYFLIRWFAYLDVVGSLSGRKNDLPLSSQYWNDDDPNVWYNKVDCLLGFTTDCLQVLARVSKLVDECSNDRINPNGTIDSSWRPAPGIVAEAERLKAEIWNGVGHTYEMCQAGSMESRDAEAAELKAANDMFHWAALIQLDRRVLNLPINDPNVQRAVKEIAEGLYKIRDGSTAESNILFPLFTAGAHALDQVQRIRIRSRLEVVETFGMSHMTKAKTLMQKVWDTGLPWESLVEDEFIG